MCGCASSSATLAPDSRATMAVVNPAAPAPTTTTSTSCDHVDGAASAPRTAARLAAPQISIPLRFTLIVTPFGHFRVFYLGRGILDCAGQPVEFGGPCSPGCAPPGTLAQGADRPTRGSKGTYG